MEQLSNIDSVTLLVVASAVIICALVLFAKAIKFLLKLAVIAVMLAFIAYFLGQAGIIEFPWAGN